MTLVEYLKPSLRLDEGAVGNPTHKSFSYQSFPVNYFADTNPPVQVYYCWA